LANESLKKRIFGPFFCHKASLSKPKLFFQGLRIFTWNHLGGTLGWHRVFKPKKTSVSWVVKFKPNYFKNKTSSTFYLSCTQLNQQIWAFSFWV